MENKSQKVYEVGTAMIIKVTGDDNGNWSSYRVVAVDVNSAILLAAKKFQEDEYVEYVKLICRLDNLD